MRSWYEFGYDGFPTGEQRRRFYRQRDDPCDSEEERDNDDETNDRPIFYYPLRDSEQGSRTSSYHSGTSGSDTASDSDKDAEARNTASCVTTSTRHHKRLGRRRRAADGAACNRCVLHSTLYEDMPAWYGASSLAFAAPSSSASKKDSFVLQHGGAPCASPLAVSNQVSLWRWFLPSRDGTKDEASGGLTCTRVEHDTSLMSCVQWSVLHPSLRLGHTAAAAAAAAVASPPPRIGHCAVSLDSLDMSLLRYFLGDHASRRPADALLLSQNRSQATFGALLGHDEEQPLFTDKGVDVHLSLVLGGAAQLSGISGSHSASQHHHHGGSHFHNGRGAAAVAPTADEAIPNSGGDNDGTSRFPNLDRVVISHSNVLCHPALCLTLIKSSTSQNVPPTPPLPPPPSPRPLPRYHTAFFPLDTPSMSIVAPRAFATLTPWPDKAAEASAICSFAYLGGTENGRDPLGFFELEVFRVHLDTWVWSSHPITTYGAKPAPRFAHSANLLRDDGCLLLFGGVGLGHAYLNDLHVLDAQTKVWREVFIPLPLDMPRRAFHMAAVLTTPHPDKTSQMGQRHGMMNSGGTRAASDFTQRVQDALGARGVLHHDGGASPRAAHEMDGAKARFHDDSGESENDVDDDDDLWSASVTTARSRSTLLLVGGECDSRPVPASWACTLRSGQWQRLAFPLRTQPQFFHVARSLCSSGSGNGVDAPPLRRLLSRTDFRAAVDSLVERSRQETGATSARAFNPQDDPYMAVCHGSLAQVFTVPSRFPGRGDGAEYLLIVGGSHGPPVSVASQLEMMDTSLKDAASLWLLAAHEQQLLSPTSRQRVPRLRTFFFRRSRALSKAAQSLLQTADDARAEWSQSLSAADARAHRLVSESVLDGQLTEWLRLARKRLRDVRP